MAYIDSLLDLNDILKQRTNSEYLLNGTLMSEIMNIIGKKDNSYNIKSNSYEKLIRYTVEEDIIPMKDDAIKTPLKPRVNVSFHDVTTFIEPDALDHEEFITKLI